MLPRALIIGATAMLAAAPLRASDLEITTGRIERDAASGILRVHARLSWQNAWRSPRNHDAVWLFLKLRPGPNAGWGHARLHAIAATARPDLACHVAADQVGGFCAPAATHRGAVSAELLVDVDSTQLPPPLRASPTLEARMFAIEMVYIPSGPFFVGDRDTTSVQYAAYYRSDANGNHAGLYRVESEAAIRVAPEAGALYYRSRTPQYEGDRQGPIPDAFPKGTRAFYVMKYEMLQGEYAGFLNHISSEYTYFRANNAGLGYFEQRGTIRLAGGAYVAAAPRRPANWVSWDDGAAFADWAGLRPMTELEFTKAARGPGEPVAGDYPWGTNSRARLLRRMGTDDELVRAGAADEAGLTDATRDVVGASHYWVMDLAGSVWEKVVTLGHPAGRRFQGTHGDGRLRAYGLATNDDWPSGDHDGGGYGYRGGG